jgi:hypothetical protein
MVCICKNWDEIHSFRTPGEFNLFVKWIHEQAAQGLISECVVQEHYAGSTFDEKLFRCNGCGCIWRLVAPEPPFLGVFEPIDRPKSRPD